MTDGRRQARTERIELVVQPLLGDPAGIDELAAMTDRTDQRLDLRPDATATPAPRSHGRRS